MTNEERVRRLLALDEKRLLAAEMAMEQLVKGLGDPKTPPTAMSNLITTAFRVSGMLDPKVDGERDLEPHEMTSEQLQRRIAQLDREKAERATPVIDAVPARNSSASTKADGSVFG